MFTAPRANHAGAAPRLANHGARLGRGDTASPSSDAPSARARGKESSPLARPALPCPASQCPPCPSPPRARECCAVPVHAPAVPMPAPSFPSPLPPPPPELPRLLPSPASLFEIPDHPSSPVLSCPVLPPPSRSRSQTKHTTFPSFVSASSVTVEPPTEPIEGI